MLARRPPCTLRLALGDTEQCPGPACPFWLDDACTLSSVDRELRYSPELARHLLDLRRTLERARASEDVTATSGFFHRLLNDEPAAEA